ncbi:MAG: HU family DNA-binding protein [Treponema sp.]|jgi:predicted histone-like DNA-binding protein|nr:HU family DNA-binding protein [Treponema sp.]
MSVKLKKIMRRNPANPSNSKWYLTPEKSGTVRVRQLSKEVGAKADLPPGDVQKALNALMELLPEYLKQGNSVKLEGLGSFRVSVKSEGANAPGELSSGSVKGVKVVFVPSAELKRNLGDVSFAIEK